MSRSCQTELAEQRIGLANFMVHTGEVGKIFKLRNGKNSLIFLNNDGKFCLIFSLNKLFEWFMHIIDLKLKM